MGDVGAVATLLNTLASWILSPDGLAEFKRRRALAAKKKEALDALQNRDMARYAQCIDELRQLGAKP